MRKINRRVRIKPNAQIWVGMYGTATSVSDDLTFYVQIDPIAGMDGGLYFDYDELEFIDA